MLVCLQFEWIGQHKRQDGGWDSTGAVYSGSYSLPDDAPLHNRITNASRRAQSPSRKSACAHRSSFGSLRPERRLPAASQGSSLLGSVRIFGRITRHSDGGLAEAGPIPGGNSRSHHQQRLVLPDANGVAFINPRPLRQTPHCWPNTLKSYVVGPIRQVRVFGLD